MTQPMYKCPFCDTPAWRTRYMLWKHMRECLRKRQEYTPTVGIHQEELAVISITNNQ